MKLLQTTFNSEFESTIKNWADDIKRNNFKALFHIYIPYDIEGAREHSDLIRNILLRELPGASIVGCSASGEIFDGHIQDEDIIVTAMIFEDATSRVEAVAVYKRKEKGSSERLSFLRSIPELKAIEILTSAPYQKFEDEIRIIDMLPEDVEVFGGFAVGDDKHAPFVFANDAPDSSDGSVVVFYCGKNLNIQTDRLMGWKAIGYPLKVTKSENDVVYEIENKPAYDIYKHYLHIKNNESFFYDALEFPCEVQIGNETTYIRHAKSVNPDGSIVMSSAIPQGSSIRLTYGDPRMIVEHTRKNSLQIRDFAPEVVSIINCLGRKLFWSEKKDIEISVISKHLQTTGFSALGEIMRYKGKTVLNNLSIVTVAMREGNAVKQVKFDEEKTENDIDFPMTARLALFINTISEELIEKNNQLNDMLYKASHDALTGVLNRGAIERIIYDHYEKNISSDEACNWHLIMFDIDNFKKINDCYGHTKGDNILKTLSRILSEYINTIPDAKAGRWGGEEFMLLISGHTDQEIEEIAENILNKIKNGFDEEIPVTISVGTTRYIPNENVKDTIDRADALLYKAKKSGKAKVCSDF